MLRKWSRIGKRREGGAKLRFYAWVKREILNAIVRPTISQRSGSFVDQRTRATSALGSGHRGEPEGHKGATEHSSALREQGASRFPRSVWACFLWMLTRRGWDVKVELRRPLKEKTGLDGCSANIEQRSKTDIGVGSKSVVLQIHKSQQQIINDSRAFLVVWSRRTLNLVSNCRNLPSASPSLEKDGCTHTVKSVLQHTKRSNNFASQVGSHEIHFLRTKHPEE